MSQSEWKVFKSNKKSELLWDFNDSSKYPQCDSEGNCKGFIFIPSSNCHSGTNFKSFMNRGDLRNTSNSECLMRCGRDPLCEHAIVGTGTANGYCHLSRVSRGGDTFNRGFLDNIRSKYDKTTMKADRSACRVVGGAPDRFHTYVKEKRGSIEEDTLHNPVIPATRNKIPGAAIGYINLKELKIGNGSIAGDQFLKLSTGATLEECRMDCTATDKCSHFIYSTPSKGCVLRRINGNVSFTPTKMLVERDSPILYIKLSKPFEKSPEKISFNGYNLLRANKDSGYNCEDHDNKDIGDMPFYECAKKCDLDASCRAWSTNMSNSYHGGNTSCTHIYDKDIQNRKTEKAFLGACKPIKLDASNKENKHLFTYFKELRIAPLTQTVKVLPEPNDNTPAVAQPEPDDLTTSKSQEKTAGSDTDTVESSSDEESPHTHDFTHNHDLTHQHEFIHHHDDKYQTLGNYVTNSDLTAKLALKSDKPADGETYALDSTLTNNYKTATESDALYSTKTELDDYKTANEANIEAQTDALETTLTNDYKTATESDALYATKTELNDYAKKAEYYNKTDSDGRYLQSDALNPYAKKTDLPNLSPYALKTDIPESPDLSPYAKKTDLPNLSPYALKTDIPAAPDLNPYAKKTDLPNLSPYALKTDIPDSPDLSPYALKTDIPDSPDLSPYALRTDIPDLNPYAKKTDLPDLSPYALKTDIPDSPDLSPYAKTSTLSAYAKKTDLPNLSPYALKTDIPDSPDLSPYAKTSTLSAYAKKTDLPDLSPYAFVSCTKTDIPDSPDLSPYALKTDIPDSPDLSPYAKTSTLSAYAKKTDLPNLSPYAKTSTLSAYAKKTDLPNLSPYALKTDIPDSPDLSPYALKTDIPDSPDLSPYALKTDVPASPDLSPYALKTDIPDSPDLSPYALKTDVPAAPDLSPYARKADHYTKTQSDDRYLQTGALSSYARKSDLEGFLKAGDIPGQPSLEGYAKFSDLSPYALKTDVPAPVPPLDLSPYALKTDVPALVPPLDLSPYALKTDVPAAPDLSPYALKTDVPAAPDLSPYARKSDLSSYALKTEINQNRPNLENYITETELEEILEDYVQDKDLPVASDVQYAEEGHTHTNDNLSEIVKQEVQNILSTEARNTGTSVSKEKFNKTVNIIILTFAILVIVMMVLFYFF